MKKMFMLFSVIISSILLATVSFNLGPFGPSSPVHAQPPAEVQIDPSYLELFKPLPSVMASKKNPTTPARVALGRMLYYDTRLSKSQTISCNSCHNLETYGVDNAPTSTGHEGQKGDRNSPTAYNAAGHFVQFWDGRAADVEAQAKGPVMNPVEMAMPTEKDVVAMLKSKPEYVAAFKKAFPGSKNPVTFDNMVNAIGAFERKLVTPSRWDKFLKGDKTALTDQEKAGFVKFVDTGCVACHLGTYVGGSMYQQLGIATPWPDTSDLGRYKVTKAEADKFFFKVPSLRNIAKTGPYFHSGSVATLEDAVNKMAEYQLGKDLSNEDVQSTVTWLNSLTGEIPGDYVKKPILPK